MGGASRPRPRQNPVWFRRLLRSGDRTASSRSKVENGQDQTKNHFGSEAHFASRKPTAARRRVKQADNLVSQNRTFRRAESRTTGRSGYSARHRKASNGPSFVEEAERFRSRRSPRPTLVLQARFGGLRKQSSILREKKIRVLLRRSRLRNGYSHNLQRSAQKVSSRSLAALGARQHGAAHGRPPFKGL